MFGFIHIFCCRPPLQVADLDLEATEDEEGPGDGGDCPPYSGGQAGEVEDDEDDSAGRRGGQALQQNQMSWADNTVKAEDTIFRKYWGAEN